MRVAIFCEYYYPFTSGVVTHIDILKKGLEEEGNEVMIVTLDPGVDEMTLKEGVLTCPAKEMKKIYGYGIANPYNRKRFQRVKDFDPEIIHLQTEFSMGLAALYCASRLKKTSVYTIHTMYDDYLFYVVPRFLMGVAKPAFRAFLRGIARRATAVIGPSRKISKYLHECGADCKVHLVPNVADVSSFRRQGADTDKIAKVREECQIGEGDTVLCFVSRMGKEKSIDVLIEYFTESFEGEHNYKLILIGDGPELPEIKDLVRMLRMERQILTLGHIDHEELPAYYHACDLFASASVTENNSISLLEATAAGLYAVNRLDSNNCEGINRGVNGDVYRNQKEFESIVREYAALSKTERDRLKKTVGDYAQQYGQKEFTEKVLSVYRTALAQ